MSLRKRRNTRGWPWVALAVAIVAVGGAAAFTLYGRAPAPPATPAPQDTIELINATLTAYPGIDAGTIGVGLVANIHNNAAMSVKNTTLWLDSIPMGSCTIAIPPLEDGQCRTGQSVSCNVMPTAAPYDIRAAVEFSNGTTYSTSLKITNQLTTFC